MAAEPEITQCDLRLRATTIMDAVAGGQAFTVTRNGRPIARLIPLRSGRRFVTRREFAAASRGAPAIDLGAFRGDQNAAAD